MVEKTIIPMVTTRGKKSLFYKAIKEQQMQRSLNELNSRERRARAADASTPSGQLPADCGYVEEQS